MRNRLENYHGVTELSTMDQSAVNGGLDVPTTKSSFWNDAGFLLGAIVKGIVVFSTQGGRNAGLTVH